LTNPAGVKRQVVGVHSAALCRPLAEVLQLLGTRRALIVHGEDGLDEISIAAAALVAELRDGSIREYRIEPEDLGIARDSLDGLTVDSAEASAALIRAAFGKSPDARAAKAGRMIAVNAAACLYVSGITADLKGGVALAEDLIATGQVREKLKEFIDFTRFLKEGVL